MVGDKFRQRKWLINAAFSLCKYICREFFFFLTFFELTLLLKTAHYRSFNSFLFSCCLRFSPPIQILILNTTGVSVSCILGLQHWQWNLYKTTAIRTTQKWSSWTGGCLIKHLYKTITNQIWSFLASCWFLFPLWMVYKQ